MHRSIQLLAVLYRFALERDVSIKALLADSGLAEKNLQEPDFLATTTQEFALIRNLCRLVPEADLGLTIGHKYNVGTLGKLGMAAIHSDTLTDALDVIHKYRELIGSYFHLDVEVTHPRAAITFTELVDLKEIRRFICEREFASIARIQSDLLGAKLRLDEVRVAYPKPPNADRYADVLDCPVHFGAARHALVFNETYLTSALPLANPLTRRTFEKECAEALTRLRSSGSVAQRVVQEIIFRREGIPDLDKMAGHLNTSPRTLRRWLNDEGVSYREVVSRIQMDEATRLLQTTSLTVREVALEVGYQDLPNFYRAFRRWTGRTPGELRPRSASTV
jgi:AraC-like DNA-binding protein